MSNQIKTQARVCKDCGHETKKYAGRTNKEIISLFLCVGGGTFGGVASREGKKNSSGGSMVDILTPRV